jgi:Rrf2 family protein
MISRTARYALRATVCLAEEDADALLDVRALARATGVPRNYLSKILHVLAREGILVSYRGPGGGFRLAVPAERLPLARIVGLFEPPPARDCLLGRARCSDRSPCRAHEEWKSVAACNAAFFENTTVADIMARTGPERTEVRR